MNEPGFVLGLYQDENAAGLILRELRRRGFACSASVQKTKDGRVSIDDNHVSTTRGVLAGGAMGVLFGLSSGLALWPFLLAVLALAVIGWLAVRRLDCGITGGLLIRYRRWLTPGETLVIVQAAAGEMGRALALLRSPGTAQPATFTLRPERMHGPTQEDQPLRKEPFAAERLAAHAARLAGEHTLASASCRPQPLLLHVRRVQRTIDRVCRETAETVQAEEALTAGVEWILDNAYLIQGQINEILRNLPRHYYEGLPVLADGPLAGLPRIYGIALELIAHTDARLDRDNIIRFLRAYQGIQPLKIGELWALPLALRLGLAESLRRLGLRVCQRQREQGQADFWANRLLSSSRRDPDQLLFFLAELTREQPEPSPYFAVRLVGQIHDEVAALVSLQGWVEYKLDLCLAEIVQQEQARQTTDQVSIANAVSSLRYLSGLKWEDVFEEVSLAEAALREDPSGVYAGMDFASRDLYRHAVEEMARRARMPEAQVALEAVALARAVGKGERTRHVGYHLVGAGRVELEVRIHCRPLLASRFRAWIRRHPAGVYLGGVGMLTAAATACVVLLAASRLRGIAPLGLLAFLTILTASEPAVQTVNFLVTRILPPSVLPKMYFAKGIPDHYRTLVTVPMMLLTPATIQGEVDRLEVRYLANPEPNLLYALLSDFADAPAEEMPEDRELLAEARAGIQRLNARYGGDLFFLLHRKRRWSESEGRWIGWERKRGKIEALNRFLTQRAGGIGELIVEVGRTAALAGIRFVLTLDADTQLPRGTARQLVETLAHPLNRPELTPGGRTVAQGYTIIQPRVSTSLPSATASHFTMVFSDPTGTDPYAHAVSDVYQDLVGAGTFYGKGIYDVRVFDRVLSGRFPEATILSHDLLEGAYVRTGLATEIELFDLFPQSYQAHVKRQHRWVRGDWQIAAWAGPRVPIAGGGRAPNPLAALDRWKILDNLRRSLVPASSLCLLGACWFLLPLPVLGSIFVGLVMLFPVITHVVSHLAAGSRSNAHTRRDLGAVLARSLFCTALMPHQAALTLDAIVRVVYRRRVSKRRLLEWETAQMAHWRYCSGDGRRGYYFQIALTSLFALGFWMLVRWLQPAALAAASPLLFLWILAPLAVWWLDTKPRHEAARPLAAKDRRLLAQIARKTWRYFDDFIGVRTSWLPPDNYQEALHVEVAQRTSPTNIGLWFLSALAAHDLGYLTTDQLIERVRATQETLAKLELYEGHYLNWYDLSTLEPLRPRYVSTVDSGNLLASLWALEQGIRQASVAPLLGPRVFQGLEDAVLLLRAAVVDERMGGHETGLARIEDLVATPPADLPASISRLHSFARELEGVAGIAAADWPAGSESAYWLKRLEETTTAWLDLAGRYFAWVEPLSNLSDEDLSPLGSELCDCRAQACALSPSLEALAGGIPLLAAVRAAQNAPVDEEGPAANVLARTADALSHAGQDARVALARVETAIGAARRLGESLNMRFLYDPERRLFAVGYNVNERRLDTSFYDLLASEARLASFVAIARGDVPNEHWVALGRPFGDGDRPALLSWNGTIFEYLMPLLLNRSFPNSLLDRANRIAVARQIEYAAKRGIPWGISEAAFSALDRHQVYQYRAFGVPGLGLKRGLEGDLVVAPYASALALAVDPKAAVENLRRLAGMGLLGRYGFYESIDFTRQRRPEGERGVVVYTYMAHHQGMTLVAIANALQAGVMPARFHADPRVRATEPLLFERIPSEPPVTELPDRPGSQPRLTPIMAARSASRFTTPHTPTPKTLLLSNGTYSLMVTNAGGGYSRWGEFDLTRWRADTTRDAWGSYFYLRDLEEGAVWSAASHPLGHPGRHYAVAFTADRAEYRRRDVGIETVTEVVVSPEDDAEIRRLTLINRSAKPRLIELTSYVELALAPHRSDRAHPAFSKLFVETEALPACGALLAWRRRRAPAEEPIWAGHVIALASPSSGPLQYETDRARFLGRHGTPRHPAALAAPLTNSAGAVLDPLFSLRCVVQLEPGQRVQVAFTTVASATRAHALALVDKYRNLAASESALQMAWNHEQLEHRHFGIRQGEAAYFQELGSYAIFPSARLRPSGERLRRNTLGQARLWAYGISGDLPLIVVAVDELKETSIVREILLAHSYLRAKGLQADLVILNGEAAGYLQPLHEELRRLIQAHALLTGTDRPGGVFLRAIGQMPEEDLTVLLAAAHITLNAARGTLAQQLSAPAQAAELPPRLRPNRRLPEEPSAPLPFLELRCFNGLGGFTPDGREYAVYLGPDLQTPAPWVNVMANPTCGAVVSEAGSGFVWYADSQNNRLIPWSNDPVSDPASSAIYLRDEDNGAVWTPTPLPIREEDAYRTRHGQGYTVFEHNSHAIAQELLVFVPMNDQGGAPLYVQRLRLCNQSSRRRRLAVFAYADWVLGTDREETQLHIVTKWDAESQVLLARNTYHPDFSRCVAFATLTSGVDSYTADRIEFIGRNGSLDRPAALDRRELSGRTGAGLDPCAALQVGLILEPGRSVDVTFLLGQGADLDEVHRLVDRYRDPYCLEEAYHAARVWWDRLLDTIQIHTPVPAVDILVNRWLLYQTLSCRIWARSGFHQSGGAYGFRDQLQDVLALVHAAPGIARAHILLAASRQFAEGDVQHWWHQPSGGGVRTRCTDDLLWLVYATAHYVQTTDDTGILYERIPFLEGRQLEEAEQEAYFEPSLSMEDGTLFEHCRRAIERGSTLGPHGLPLIGTGDWNDGMNRVGCLGQGESVWLAWFLIEVLHGFARLCLHAGEVDLAEQARERAASLAHAVEDQAWDGRWYRRAYFDDGSPLGAGENPEARIDSIPQAWAAIADAGAWSRIGQALAEVEEQLVRKEEGLVLLFAPPLDRSSLDPGYIRAYPPGVRENGGQYTHAAVWLAMAYARLGDGNRAAALLQLLNPIEHTRTPEEVARYKVEPYVVAADVYALEGRVGQGGWTWYTGASGWMYRVWIEEVLGFKRRGAELTIDPAISADWPAYDLAYRYGDTWYDVHVENPDHVCQGASSVELDGRPLPSRVVPLRDDGGRHRVLVQLVKAQSPLSAAIEEREEHECPGDRRAPVAP